MKMHSKADLAIKSQQQSVDMLERRMIDQIRSRRRKEEIWASSGKNSSNSNYLTILKWQ